MFRSRVLLRPVAFARLYPGRLQPRWTQTVRLFSKPSTGTLAASPEDSVTYAVERLRNSKEASDVQVLYPGLLMAMEEASKAQNPSQHFHDEDVKLLLFKLAASGRPEDMQRIEDVIHTLLPRLRIEPSVDVYQAVLRGLASRKETYVTRAWLARMASVHSPDIKHVNYVLGEVSFSSFEEMRLFVLALRGECGYKADEDTVRTLLRRAWDIANERGRIPPAGEFIGFIESLESWRAPWSQETASMLFQLYANAGREDVAIRVANRYGRGRDRDLPSIDQGLLLELERLKKEGGLQKAVEALPPLDDESKEGRVLQMRIGSLLLKDSRSLADLQLLDKVLFAYGGTRRWAQVIKTLLFDGNLDEALKVYQESRKANVPIDAGLVAPLLTYMTYEAEGAGSDELIMTSFAIYNDFVEYADANPRSPGFHSVTPDEDIFRTLFRSLAKAKNLDKHDQLVDTLLNDMQRYNCASTSNIAASVIMIGMRRASSADAALETYRAGKELLDSDGYASVLSTFLDRCFKPDKILSAVRDYFTIVKDMQRSGTPVTSRVYTVLLQSIGITASNLKRKDQLTEEVHEYLVTATRRAHDHLTLDPSFSPHPVVFSQLINTYQRLGCLGDAYRVWELMYLTGTYSSHTVSNILDGCGYAGDFFTARSVWYKLAKDGFKFGQKHWETYIECLCRMGQVKEALRVLLDEMPEIFDQAFCVHLLSQWARKYKMSDYVAATLERYNPSLYHKTQQKYKWR